MIYLTQIFNVTTVVILLVLATACSQEPAKIHYGSDECAHCKMMISDAQFASQIVTDKGKALKFDAIECMAVYHRMNSEDLQEAKLYVSNYNKAETWLNAQEAQFVKSEEINTPMGESLLAFPSRVKAQKHIQEQPGTLLNWREVSQTQMK